MICATTSPLNPPEDMGTTDEPIFTQPKLVQVYKAIKGHPALLDVYKNSISNEVSSNIYNK